MANLLPNRIAERLKAGDRNIADSHGEATVFFADLVGFTALTDRLSPGHLIEVLNEVFSRIDEVTEKYGVEK
jgi:adenylate cyclase